MHLFSHDRFHQLPVVIEFFNCLLQGVGFFQNPQWFRKGIVPNGNYHVKTV